MRRHPGFTLVELSIVLVILGLLVGGVLTGQSLIRASELRSVTTQFNNFLAAEQTFRSKYFAIPGDMGNATSFWGAAAAGAACATTQGSGTQTCDGNANGQIEYAYANSNESMRFWQQLAIAGLIEGSYSGIGVGTTYGVTTTNSPAGKLGTSLWWINYVGPMSGATQMFNGDYGHILEFGSYLANNDPVNPIFKPEEAWNIDTKIDDGLPATGRVVIRAQAGLATCTNTGSNSNMSANYLLSGTSQTCSLYFRNLF